MPASSRTRTATSSRPYDRRSPTASPTLWTDGPPPLETPDSPPDHPGLPTYAEYKQIEAGYLRSLSPRKRDKALITQAMFDKIWDVLHQPDACTVETPQFRFWVRKMFTLSRLTGATTEAQWQWDGGLAATQLPDVDPNGERQGGRPDDNDDEAADLALEHAMGIARADTSATLANAVVLHENRPVAIMEQLYELFCYCHVRAGHGGRDKTCAVIRQHYSWVPKELTAQFVKACPTCAVKRSGGELGVVVQRRSVVGRRRARELVRGIGAPPTPLEWPTTGGPLDPGNEPPCGVRERERRRRRRSHEHGLAPPGRDAETPPEGAFARGWDGPVHALDASAIAYPCPYDPPAHGTAAGFSPTTRPALGVLQAPRTGSPAGYLPPLASALSNEPPDDGVNLTSLGPNGGDDLPPALLPLRLTGPVMAPGTEADADLFPCQIDPVLLSFSYPSTDVLSSPVACADAPSSAGRRYGGTRYYYEDEGVLATMRLPCVERFTAI